MAARGYRISRAIGCWGALRSEERLVASLTATPQSGVRSGAERILLFWTSSWPPHSFSNCKHCGMLNLEYRPCTPVTKKSNTSHSSVFFSRSVLSCMRIPARSLPCSQSGHCSFRKSGLYELVCLRQMFVRGG